MGNPHLEVILVHHPVIQHKERDLRFRCLVDPGNPQSFLAASTEGVYFCAACGNELGRQGQLRISWRHENAVVYMAFL